MRVRDFMSSCPATIRAEDSVARCAALMREHGVGCLPVTDAWEHLQGIVTDRDLVVRAVAKGLEPTVGVGAVMTPDCFTTEPDEELDALLVRWTRAPYFRVLVVEAGRVIGVVSLADVSRVERSARFGELASAVFAREAAPPPSFR